MNKYTSATSAMAIFGCINKLRESDHSVDVEWKIENFFSLLENANKSLQSPDFNFLHSTWSLKIEIQGTDHEIIGIFLHKTDSGPHDVAISFGIRLNEGTEEMRCYLIKNFGDSSHGFGTQEFILLSEVTGRQCEMVPSGVLTIICSVGDRRIVTMPQLISFQSIRSKDLDTLSRSLKELFDCKNNSDVIINVGEQEFPVHKAILTARSTVFAAMFRHETSEKKSGTINIADCDPVVFKDFLLYLYTGKAEDLSTSNVCHIYRIADKYNVQDLKSLCTAFMKRNVSMTNLFDVFVLANQFNEAELIAAAQNVFNKSAHEIVTGDEWESFLKHNFPVANQLLVKAFAKVKVEH